MPGVARSRGPTGRATREATFGDLVRRFGLSVKDEGARSWFRNAIANQLLHSLAFGKRSGFDLDSYAFGMATHLGVAYRPSQISTARLVGDGGAMSVYLPTSFWEFLAAIEYLVGALPPEYSSMLEDSVVDAVANAPGPLGVRWARRRFMRSAAPELDEPLGAQPLQWLASAGLDGVKRPFELALRSLMGADDVPAKRREAIKYAYEALEATAQAVCGNKRDLSGNRELFLKNVGVLPALRTALEDFVKFANPYRHGQHPEPIPDPSYSWAEESVYLTGIFLRAASTWMRGRRESSHVAAKGDSTRAPRPRPGKS